jgi:hypothetical protein
MRACQHQVALYFLGIRAILLVAPLLALHGVQRERGGKAHQHEHHAQDQHHCANHEHHRRDRVAVTRSADELDRPGVTGGARAEAIDKGPMYINTIL